MYSDRCQGRGLAGESKDIWIDSVGLARLFIAFLLVSSTLLEVAVELSTMNIYPIRPVIFARSLRSRHRDLESTERINLCFFDFQPDELLTVTNHH